VGVGLLFLGLAAAPGTAMAAGPVVTTGAASEITGWSATLNGTVNAQGAASTDYGFQYGLANSDWCQSGGATGSPATSSNRAFGFSDSTAHAVSETAGNGYLTPGASWCFRVRASNAGTPAVGDFATFTTPARVVRTDPATSIINGGATLNGTLNTQGERFPGPNHFDYGPSSSDWCMSGGTSQAPSIAYPGEFFQFSDSSDHPVSAVAGELTPNTSYCFRFVYGNGNGTYGQQGSLLTFTTPPLATLSVNVTGPGHVTGIFPHQDISCRGTAPHGLCTTAYVPVTEVTLDWSTYAEETGGETGKEAGGAPQQFVGWSGACSGTGRYCALTMSGDMTVGATFTSDSSPPSDAGVDHALAAVLTPSGPAASIAAILKAGSYPAAFEAPGAGKAQIAWYQGSPSARSARAQKSLLVAKGAKTFTEAGKATIKIKLTAKGKALLGKVKKGQKLALSAKGSFTPKGGKQTSKQKSFTLKG
jgi:hypothetical protein